MIDSLMCIIYININIQQSFVWKVAWFTPDSHLGFAVLLDTGNLRLPDRLLLPSPAEKKISSYATEANVALEALDAV